MYTKPRVERFGTFRELTRAGFNLTGDDGFIIRDKSTGYETTGCELLACRS